MKFELAAQTRIQVNSKRRSTMVTATKFTQNQQLMLRDPNEKPPVLIITRPTSNRTHTTSTIGVRRTHNTHVIACKQLLAAHAEQMLGNWVKRPLNQHCLCAFVAFHATASEEYNFRWIFLTIYNCGTSKDINYPRA